MHARQKVCKHEKYFGTFRVSRQIEQTVKPSTVSDKSFDVDGLVSIASAIVPQM